MGLFRKPKPPPAEPPQTAPRGDPHPLPARPTPGAVPTSDQAAPRPNVSTDGADERRDGPAEGGSSQRKERLEAALAVAEAAVVERVKAEAGLVAAVEPTMGNPWPVDVPSKNPRINALRSENLDLFKGARRPHKRPP